jgi:hypothetical protein
LWWLRSSQTAGNKFDVTAVRTSSSALVPHMTGKGRPGVATVCITPFMNEATAEKQVVYVPRGLL